MLKKIIAFKDYNGNDQTEEAYFYLNKFELTEIESKTPGGIVNSIVNWHKEGNYEKLFDVVKELILKGYGIKAEDGLHFIKTTDDGHKLRNHFEQSAAFEALMDDLLDENDPTGIKLATFLKDILPEKMTKGAVIPQNPASNMN